jgi:hypothetical protein
MGRSLPSLSWKSPAGNHQHLRSPLTFSEYGTCTAVLTTQAREPMVTFSESVDDRF